MLEKFQDLEEILRIVQFQTGKNLDQLAEGTGYSGGYLRAERKKNENNNLLEAIKTKYASEIEQFVIRFGRLYVEQGKKEDSKSVVQGVNQEEGIELSLKGLSAAQISMQNKLDVLFEAFAQVASGGDKKKADVLMREWGKRVASKGMEKHHKGNETDGHKISM